MIYPRITISKMILTYIYIHHESVCVSFFFFFSKAFLKSLDIKVRIYSNIMALLEFFMLFGSDETETLYTCTLSPCILISLYSFMKNLFKEITWNNMNT
jgi:hypothetical protein